MRLSRSGHYRNSGTTELFDKKPTISWNKKSKELNLSVKGIRGVSGDPSRYNFWVSLTATDLQAIVGSLIGEVLITVE